MVAPGTEYQPTSLIGRSIPEHSSTIDHQAW
jgi:hypothetical protein